MSRRRRRPVLLAIIAWLTMTGGIFGMIGLALLMDHPTYVEMVKKSPVPYPTVCAFLVDISWTFCGLFLLKGVGWMRWLFVANVGASFVLAPTNAKMPWLAYAGLAANLAFITILFLPKVNAWFASVREHGGD